MPLTKMEQKEDRHKKNMLAEAHAFFCRRSITDTTDTTPFPLQLESESIYVRVSNSFAERGPRFFTDADSDLNKDF